MMHPYKEVTRVKGQLGYHYRHNSVNQIYYKFKGITNSYGRMIKVE